MEQHPVSGRLSWAPCLFRPVRIPPPPTFLPYRYDPSVAVALPLPTPVSEFSDYGIELAERLHLSNSDTADPSGVSYFESLGYALDGIEGYVFPTSTYPQPPGTVRLMRKYHPDRDDFAIFPETELANMQAQGYTQNGASLNDWVGYVYAF